MTDSEKLDLLLKKVTGLEQQVTGLEQQVTVLEQDIVEVKVDLRRLHRNDNLILDEVERVHEILSDHMKDTTKHTA